MQRMIISTDDIPERDRFSYWHDAIGEQFLAIGGERGEESEAPFSARTVGFISNSLRITRTSADNHMVVRRRHHVARRSWGDYFLLARQGSAGAWYQHGKREFIARAGDFVVCDPDVPFATRPLMRLDHVVCMLPRRLLEPHLSAARRSSHLVLQGGAGLASIVNAYLDGVIRGADALDEHTVGLVADNFCRLVAIACGAPTGEHTESLRVAKLEETKRYIRLHIGDPSLSPETVAVALKMSVRQLHLLFAPSGSSFMQYVTRWRLEECRAALMNPIGDRSVTDVALAWGFNSLRTFHRNFRRTFGVTPGELRRQAMDVGPSCAQRLSILR
jgi:AraC-like DNA-binding protein